MKQFALALAALIAISTIAIKNKISNESYDVLINQAELAIINKEYLTSVKNYNQAFSMSHPILSDDLYNAMKVSQETKSYELTFFTAKKLIERGMCIDFLHELDIKGIGAAQWKELNELAKARESEENKYRITLEQMLNKDQNVRFGIRDRDLINEVDSLNFIQFKDLINKFGFPSEEKIGIECSDSKKGIAPLPSKILMLHFAQQRFDGIKTILSDALANDNISPYHFMDYIRFTGKSPKYYPVPIIKIGEDYYKYRLTEETINEVNINRKKIGASSLEDHIKKIKHILINGSDGYRFFRPVDQFPLQPEDVIKSGFVKLEL